MVESKERYSLDKVTRRSLGVHLTSKDIFRDYILPFIKEDLDRFSWIDLYAGGGNLMLPILESISTSKRINFFSDHLFMLDIQHDMVNRCIENAESYGIPRRIAEKNIIQYDCLEKFPKFLKESKFPLYHITNPPYLYLGYIKKHKETENLLKYFREKNRGYQDLYQIAMMNDLRNDVKKLIYIIPSNFIFGSSVSNKFRLDFLRIYNIIKMIIFEKQIFEHTGTNTCLCFFEKKQFPEENIIQFRGTKIKKGREFNTLYYLKPKFKYRAGSKFDEFLIQFRAKRPLKVKYYLKKEDIENSMGSYKVRVIDTNNYNSNHYKIVNLAINKELNDRIKSNILYIRTVDTGMESGRAGLYEIKKNFGVDGIFVSKATYRTSPIQVFLDPQLERQDHLLLKYFFNFVLEYFRKKLDSEFLTTYKYSNSNYTRKYLGLTHVRSLIETFPLLYLNTEQRDQILHAIESNSFSELKQLLKYINKT